MTQTPTFTERLVTHASGQGSLQSKGNLILKMAEALRPYIAEWLAACRTPDGLPVQPAAVRAVALNTAQILLKNQHS